MYILFFNPIFSFENFIKYPFKWVIKLFSQSKFNHVGHTIIKNEKMFVSEAKSPYYRHIELDKCIKESKSKVYAYKVVKDIDYEKLKKFERKMLGRSYDTKGAIYSEAHKVPILGNIFEATKGDEKQFCSETEIELYQNQAWIDNRLNENLYSPQEVLELILDLEIVNPKYEVWCELED